MALGGVVDAHTYSPAAVARARIACPAWPNSHERPVSLTATFAAPRTSQNAANPASQRDYCIEFRRAWRRAGDPGGSRSGTSCESASTCDPCGRRG